MARAARAVGAGHAAPWARWWLALAAYVGLNALSQGLVSGTADLDQAEQLLLSQHLAWGYGGQPPLYTWLVWVWLRCTGVALAPLLALKALLLAAWLAVWLALGRQLGFDARQQAWSVAGLAWWPTLLWEAQRDLSHTVLACLLASAALWQLLRLAAAPSRRQALALGLLLGLGALSKYNLLLFQAALLLAALSLRRYRQALCTRRAPGALGLPLLAWALLAAAGVVAPHAAWVWQHPQLAGAGLAKLQPAQVAVWHSVALAALAVLAAAAPWALAWAGTAWPWLRARWRGPHPPADAEPALHLLLRLPLAVLVGLGWVALISAGQHWSERWMAPLLCSLALLPGVLAAGVPGQPGSGAGPRSTRVWVGLAGMLAVVAALALPGRTWLAAETGQAGRPNQPVPELVSDAATRLAPDAAFVVADTSWLGGNARLALPQAPVWVPAVPATAAPLQGTGLLLCLAPACQPALWQAVLAPHLGPGAGLPWQRVQRPWRYLPQRQLQLLALRVCVQGQQWRAC